jgi:hypothetical protein
LRKDFPVLTQTRVPRLFLAAKLLLLCFTVLLLLPSAAHSDLEPRVANAYTAWDDYFFYAAFQINDHNVISTNRTPISQPQQDDDIEVFFDTQPSNASTVRTINTYQMAVSAGSGAYFSQGDGTKVPKGKLVLTYKYAVTIDGSLNDPNDNDTGFTVEIAIPWEELGLSGPPAPGQVFGFNIVSRNRDSEDMPATSFASLSNLVHSNDDVQNPSKWTKIEFISTLANQVSGPSHVFCPHIVSDTNYPVIDGIVRSGEWNTNFGFAFGTQMIRAAAPTQKEEPNISESPFANALQPVVRTPVSNAQQANIPSPDNPDYTITLPGGGEVHVGKMMTPPPQPFIPTEPIERGHRHGAYQPGSLTNPLAPNLPPEGEMGAPPGPTIDSTATLALTEQITLAPLVLATYYYSYPDHVTPIDYLDQPMDGFGPAFGGNHAQWHLGQLADARRAGVDVLLVSIDPSNPDSATGLAALVEAMKEMADKGDDYPLLGLKIDGDPVAALREFLTLVPEQFRAEVQLPDKEFNQPAYIVFANTLPDVDALKKLLTSDFSTQATVLVTTPDGNNFLQIAQVSPGGRDSEYSVTGREQTHTYAKAWQQVYSNNPNWVLINSWNDYLHGTEVAASREYAEQYADLTRIAGLQWSGAEQWDAKYLQNNVPTVIAPKTIYTVSIRVENNGSLPWRAGENYALCYRWYKDGRLYDDSAPRIPLARDIYPGESTTVNVGVVAQNSFGTDIEPGRYTLVFDMIQGQDRWFSYIGSEPLRVPVRVEDEVDAAASQAVVLRSTTPAIVDSSGRYQVSLFIRNEGQETWTPANTTVTLDGNRTSSVGKFDTTVNPGAIGEATTTIQIPADQSAGQIGTLTWTVKTPGSTTAWNEHPYIVPHDLGASFSINDIDREVKSGEVGSARVGLVNTGPYTWNKGAWKLDYAWYYLDGLPAGDIQGKIPITTIVAPGDDAEVDFNFRTPPYPGRYQLVMDVEAPDGTTTLTQPATSGRSVLPLLVSVIPGKNAMAYPVDLTKDYDSDGIGYETSPELGDFNGKGGSLPGTFMPPDGTQEVGVNPLLAGKPGPPEYPSGYYSSVTADGVVSGHRISFLYGPKGANNVITCNGQLIILPEGNWKAIHVLAASVSGADTVSDEFGVAYKDGISVTNLSVANWAKVPDPAVASVGLRLPYTLTKGSVAQGAPVFLGDYVMAADPKRKLEKLSLPIDPLVKVLAITLER